MVCLLELFHWKLLPAAAGDEAGRMRPVTLKLGSSLQVRLFTLQKKQIKDIRL